MVTRLMSAIGLGTALLLPSTPAVAQDPIEVSAHASFSPVSPGGFQDADCLVENTSGEPVLAIISADVTYADGDVQRFHLNQGPTLIDPNGAFLLSIGFAVPEDAATGTATFTCSVRAVGPGGGGFADSASATFEVA